MADNIKAAKPEIDAPTLGERPPQAISELERRQEKVRLEYEIERWGKRVEEIQAKLKKIEGRKREYEDALKKLTEK